MALTPTVRRLLRRRPGGVQTRTEIALRVHTEAVCAATTFVNQTRRLIELFAGIWLQPSNRAFKSSLTGWVEMLEQDSDLRSRFQLTWKSMVDSLNSVSLFAEAGLPAQHALLPEITRRLFQRLLP